jgi:hypothetical protein
VKFQTWSPPFEMIVGSLSHNSLPDFMLPSYTAPRIVASLGELWIAYSTSKLTGKVAPGATSRGHRKFETRSKPRLVEAETSAKAPTSKSVTKSKSVIKWSLRIWSASVLHVGTSSVPRGLGDII